MSTSLGDSGDKINFDEKAKPSKPKFYPDVLVVGPGAEKGYYELGALHYLESEKYLTKVKYCACCSVGAIICLLWIAGYSFKSSIEKMKEKDTFDVLGDISISTILSKSGLFSNSGLKDFITELVNKKVGYTPSLYNLYMISGIELCIVATNLNRKKHEQYLTYKSNPDLSCVDAVLLSTCVPYVLPRLEYKGYSMIDGAFSNPYPINVYDDGNNKILGIYIDEQSYTKKIRNNFDYLNQIINTTMDVIRDLKIERSSDKCYHLSLSTSKKVKNHINPDLEDKSTMINHGKNISKEFIDLIENHKEYDIVFKDKEEIPFLKKVKK